jgi:hypothetical protein
VNVSASKAVSVSSGEIFITWSDFSG